MKLTTGTQTMLRPLVDEMTPLDCVVYDPRFAPFRGWHCDYRKEHAAASVTDVGGRRRYRTSLERISTGYLAAMWQIRSEFHAFADALAERGINGRCLQLGLGFGPSHMVFKQMFDDVWTVEMDQSNVTNLVNSVGPIDTIVIGSTHDSHIREEVKASGSFDLLFIDADHRIDAIQADFHDYSPMVRPGGVIALHDAFPEREDNGIWLFLSRLRSSGHKISIIGNELGIAWFAQE